MTRSASISQLMVLALLVAGIVIFFSGPLPAQDTLPSKSGKVVRIKVDIDEDGKSVNMDTSFVMDENFDMDRFNEAMKEYEFRMQDFEEAMKEGEFTFEIQKKVMQDAESTLRDIQRDLPRRIRAHSDCRAPRYFEYPGRPERENVFIYDSPAGHRNFRVKSRDRGESLNDVLGDIPMRAVKNYRIKEIKGGKRIIIDVAEDAFFDHPDENIVIWREAVPSPPPPPPPPPPKVMKETVIEKKVDPDKGE